MKVLAELVCFKKNSPALQNVKVLVPQKLLFGGLRSDRNSTKKERQWGAGCNQTILAWYKVHWRSHGKATRNTALGNLSVWKLCKTASFPRRNKESLAICHFSCPLKIGFLVAGMWRQADRGTSEQETQPCCLWAVWLEANCLTSLFRNRFTWFKWANNIGDRDQFRQTPGWRAH